MRHRESIWFVYGKNGKCLRQAHVIPFSAEAKTRALPASLENTKIKRPLQHRRFNVYRSKTLEVASMNSPLCLSYLFQRKLPDFVVLRLTGFVFLLLLISLLQKHKTCRPQSNKIKQFVLEKKRTSADPRQGPEVSAARVCQMEIRGAIQ